MILKAPTPLLGVGGGNATSAEDSTQKAIHVMSTEESQRRAEMGCESWTKDEKTVKDAKVSRKRRRTLSTSGKKNVSIGVKWKRMHDMEEVKSC